VPQFFYSMLAPLTLFVIVGTATAGVCFAYAHVDGVDVRPFLLIYLNGDEMRVEKRGNIRILKAFMRHYMAPVAG
jgi:hypothetical protein